MESTPQFPQPDNSHDPKLIGEVLRELFDREPEVMFTEDPSAQERKRELELLDFLEEVADYRRQKLEIVDRRHAGQKIDYAHERLVDQSLAEALGRLAQFYDSGTSRPE